VARLVAPLVLVACPSVVSFPRAVYKQAISYPQATRTILVLYCHKMISVELFGGVENNIRA
jgi:hypothetical protein